MNTTRDHSLATDAPARTCEHGWQCESRHATSEGIVLYVRCMACGARRVDLQSIGALVPMSLSRAVRDGADGGGRA